MKPLKVIVVPWVRGEDGQVISSERIRYGEIDRKGKNYYKVLTDTKCWILPKLLRPALREPLGEVFEGSLSEKKSIVKRIVSTIQKTNPPMVFAIGDIIVESLKGVGYLPSVEVVDLRSRREALKENLKFEIRNLKTRKYRNGAGTIEVSTVRRLKSLCNTYLKVNTPQSLIINGEEDLMVLPAILVAPLSSLVLYGQYNLGVVAVTVTEEKKAEVLKLVSQFNLL